jgi:hypothetical protein
MMNYPKIIDAIIALKSDVKVAVRGTEIIWHDDVGNAIPNPTGITQEQIDDKYAELQAEYDAQDYARKREAEYPSIQDLVVALYDTDDKAAIDSKRAEIKLKYPKPVA